VLWSYQAEDAEVQCQISWCDIYDAAICGDRCLWTHAFLSDLWHCKLAKDLFERTQLTCILARAQLPLLY
jgi:hypothetical protein